MSHHEFMITIRRTCDHNSVVVFSAMNVHDVMQYKRYHTPLDDVIQCDVSMSLILLSL